VAISKGGRGICPLRFGVVLHPSPCLGTRGRRLTGILDHITARRAPSMFMESALGSYGRLPLEPKPFEESKVEGLASCRSLAGRCSEHWSLRLCLFQIEQICFKFEAVNRHKIYV
jgi:hypothetical protein